MGQAPSNPPPVERRKNARKWAKRGLIAVLVYMIYPIGVTLALSTGLVEKLLASEDLRVEITAPSFSLLPGDVHMGRVKVFMNGDTQFILSADNVTAQIRLLPLFRRRFEVSSLVAKNVRYQMRVQVDDENADSARARAFPPLPGLPGNPTQSEDVAEETEERDPTWTVRLDGIDVRVSELWFFEYRYLGDGRLKGGFERGPDIMRVDTSVQDLGPGELRFGAEQVISRNFEGQIEAEIPELDPSEHADTSFFEYVIAKIRLHADLDTLKHIAVYIPGKTEVKGGAGPLDVKIAMSKGLLAPETSITYSTSDVNLKGPGFGVKTDLDFVIRMEESDPKPKGSTALALASSAPTVPAPAVPATTSPTPRGPASTNPPPASRDNAQASSVAARGPRPHVRSKSKITYVSFASYGQRAFTIQVQGHEETASLNSAQISRATEVASARLHMQKIVTEDLDDLDTLVSKEDSVTTDAGRARASLTLELDEKRRLSGPFRAKFDGASFALAPLRVTTNGQADLALSIDPKSDRASVSDLNLALRGTQFKIHDKTVEDWWINVKSERIAFTGLPADNIRGDLSIVARDAEPIIRALAEEDKLPDIVADIIKLRNLSIQAKVGKNNDTVDIMLDTLESQMIDFSGRVLQGPDENRVALLIGGKTLSLGIDKNGEHTAFQAFAGTDWLNEKLTHFPKPREFVQGPKP